MTEYLTPRVLEPDRCDVCGGPCVCGHPYSDREPPPSFEKLTVIHKGSLRDAGGEEFDEWIDATTGLLAYGLISVCPEESRPDEYGRGKYGRFEIIVRFTPATEEK